MIRGEGAISLMIRGEPNSLTTIPEGFGLWR